MVKKLYKGLCHTCHHLYETARIEDVEENQCFDCWHRSRQTYQMIIDYTIATIGSLGILTLVYYVIKLI